MLRGLLDMKKERKLSMTELTADGGLDEYMKLSKYNVLMLHSLGFLPYVSSTWPWRSRLLWIPHIANLLIGFVAIGECASVAYFAIHFGSDGGLTGLVDAATAAASALLGSYKMCVLIRKREVVERFLQEFAAKWHGAWKDSQNHSEMVSSAKFCRTITVTYFFAVAATVLNYLTWPILNKLFEKLTDAPRNGSVHRPMPFPTYYPWEYQKTPYYEIFYVAQCFGGIFICQIIVCFETTFCMFVTHACIHFKVLQDQLSHLNEGTTHSQYKDDKNEDEKYEKCLELSHPTDQIYRKIIKCVKRHDMLIGYTQDMEALFSPVIFMELVCSAFIITLVALQMIMLSDDDFAKLVRFIAYLMAMLLQVFIYCLFGTLLTEESERVVSASWSGNLWNKEMQEHHRKALLLMMRRASRPCYLTAAKFFNASLGQFTAIVSSAGSYYAIFRKFMK